MSETPLDEAYTRLLSTGPEFDGWLSNHGPMAAEALVRHGHTETLMRWVEAYTARLEPAPSFRRPIREWRMALGDPFRLGDWLRHFDEAVREESWDSVLHRWWPRLLPGIAAGATHGVIRVGHAVRVLREEGESPVRVAELGQGLAYWAARWQPVPAARRPQGPLGSDEALDGLPLIASPAGGIRERFDQLASTPGWTSGQQALAAPEDAEIFLRSLVTASVRRYATHAHGDPVMLVHAATAPNAVLRALPSLPSTVWRASAEMAWSASAAVHAAYSPHSAHLAHHGVRALPGQPTCEDTFARAVAHGDEHVIKLADTALDVHRWTGDPTALAAVDRAAELVDPA